jgi:transposase
VRRRYLVGFRRKVLDLIEAGRPVAEVAAQLGITGHTIHGWPNQDQMVRGPRERVSAT